MKTIGTILGFAAIALMAITVLPTKTYAKQECFTQYGGGETCVDVNEDAKLRVDKKIYNPKSKDYENNISRKDGSYPYTFKEDDKIYFKIVVENTGDVEIDDIKLIDIMPSIIEYRSGDGDDKDDGHRVEFGKFDLKPGEDKEFEFSAKVNMNGISPDDDYICVSNVAKAKGDRKDNGDEESNADYANFCVEVSGKVLGKESPKRLPTTGEVDMSVVFLGLSGVGLAFVGYGLKKFTKLEK